MIEDSFARKHKELQVGELQGIYGSIGSAKADGNVSQPLTGSGHEQGELNPETQKTKFQKTIEDISSTRVEKAATQALPNSGSGQTENEPHVVEVQIGDLAMETGQLISEIESVISNPSKLEVLKTSPFHVSVESQIQLAGTLGGSRVGIADSQETSGERTASTNGASFHKIDTGKTTQASGEFLIQEAPPKEGFTSNVEPTLLPALDVISLRTGNNETSDQRIVKELGLAKSKFFSESWLVAQSATTGEKSKSEFGFDSKDSGAALNRRIPAVTKEATSAETILSVNSDWSNNNVFVVPTHQSEIFKTKFKASSENELAVNVRIPAHFSGPYLGAEFNFQNQGVHLNREAFGNTHSIDYGVIESTGERANEVGAGLLNKFAHPITNKTVFHQIRSAFGNEGKTTVKLSPEGLGLVEVEVKTLDEGNLRIVVRAQNPEVLASLISSRADIEKFLSEPESSNFVELEFEQFDQEQEQHEHNSRQPSSNSSSDLQRERETGKNDYNHIVKKDELDILA